MKYLNKILKKIKGEKGIVGKKYIARYLMEDPIIVEAGAHIGSDTIEMARQWPKSKIYAFEPVPNIYNQLISNTSCFENINCINMALGEKTGSCMIHQSSGKSDGSSSLLEPKEHLKYHPDVLFNNRIKVKVITIYDWALENKIGKIDFLWLDLQGFELNVLKASEKLIKKTKAIYTEVSTVENYAGSALYPELKEWLISCGFIVQKEKIAWEDGGNVLFINSRI